MIEKVYSLRELVPEIYGIDPTKSKNVDAHYKELTRVDKLLRGLSDVPESKGIMESYKENYVNLMKAIIFDDGNFKNILNKICNNKKVSNEECMSLINLMLNNLSGESKRDKVEYKISKYDEFYKRIENIEERTTGILSGVVKYFDEDALFLTYEVFKDCEEKISLILDNFEKEIKEVEDYVNLRKGQLDYINDMIFDDKIEKIISSTMASSKHKHLTNKFNK